MPVFPFLLSLLYEPGLSDEAFFLRGKWLNVGLSLISLPILFWVFYRYLSLFTAVNLLLIHAFTVYMFKAAYTQAELLFYLFNFLGFILLCHLLQQVSWRDSWKTAVFTGILLGTAHLTKASILPGLALFLGIAILKVIVRQGQKRPNLQQLPGTLSELITPGLVLFFFLLTIWPYLQNSKAQFGHYFYNVNSTFYVWYDHWDEVESGTNAHGDLFGWPDMPADEIPSAVKYFREHSLGQAAQRLFEGYLVTWLTMQHSYGYLKYVCLYLGMVVALMLLNYRQIKHIIQTYPFLFLFVLGYFLGYLTLYAWFWPISSGNRFVLALFSPLMFTLAFTIYRLFTDYLTVKISKHSSKTVHLGQLLNGATFVILLVDVYIIMTYRIGTLYGGY